MSRPTPRCPQCARPLAAVPVQAGQPAAAVDHDPAAPLHHGLAEAPQDLRAGAGPGAASSLLSRVHRDIVQDWIVDYRANINSPPSCVNEWNEMPDILVKQKQFYCEAQEKG